MADLSIIIVTYRGWKRLDKCLESITGFTNARFSKEVIIADNTPDRGEISAIKSKFPHFVYIHNPVNGGYGYAVNRAAEHSTGKYLLVLNPDTVGGEAAIDEMISAALIHPDYSIISCRQVNDKGKECNVMAPFPEFRNITGLIRSVSGKKTFRSEGDFIFPDWVSGSVMLISKEIFQSIGGFNDDYWMYFEDVDICKRVWDSGGKVALMKNVTIEHNHGGSSRIDLRTTSLTKTEVHISRHVYISRHRKGFTEAGLQGFLVVNNMITNFLLAVPGLIFFFVPRVFIRAVIFKRLAAYYLKAAARGSWLSPQSVNYRQG